MADLISRAAAIEICKSIVPNTNPDFYNLRSKAGYGSWMHSNGEVCAITNIETKIEALPAVDAVPVVQGEWVEEPDRRGHYHCSNCGVVWGVPAKAMKYCPNCAAKMMNSPMWEVDGERRDDDGADA